MLSGETTNTNFIVFGFTWPGLEASIYHTRRNLTGPWGIDLPYSKRTWLGLEASIYHTRSEPDRALKHRSTILEANMTGPWSIDLPYSRRTWPGLEVSIYHTRSEPDRPLKHRSTILEANTLTITPLIWSQLLRQNTKIVNEHDKTI
jgi:hypothetical protein